MPVAAALLLDAIARIRNGATDPYDIPPDRLPPGLDLPAARALLRKALTDLGAFHPDFYYANITIPTTPQLPLADHDLVPAQSPEDLLVNAEVAAEARMCLSTSTYRLS